MRGRNNDSAALILERFLRCLLLIFELNLLNHLVGWIFLEIVPKTMERYLGWDHKVMAPYMDSYKDCSGSFPNPI